MIKLRELSHADLVLLKKKKKEHCFVKGHGTRELAYVISRYHYVRYGKKVEGEREKSKEMEKEEKTTGRIVLSL